MDSLCALRYLVALAEHGSFTRAAEAMNITQPSLSQQIKKLEKHLMVPLVDRTGRSIRLTDAGDIYVRYARRALSELAAGDQAVRGVSKLQQGSVRLGWTPITDYLAFPLVRTYIQRYPEVLLKTLQLPQDEIEIAVAEDRIDLGIVFSRHFPPSGRGKKIEVKSLFYDEFFLAVNPRHPLALRSRPVGPRDLVNEPLVLLNTEFALRRHIDQYCTYHEIVPRIEIETNSLNLILEMVQACNLASILPGRIIATQCGLAAVHLSPKIRPKSISLIHRKRGYLSPACRAFVDAALEWANEIPPLRVPKIRDYCPLKSVDSKSSSAKPVTPVIQ